MNFLQLHILCNRDTRSEEDIALEQQMASLEIPVKTSQENKIIQEWRLGVIQVSHIACIYPHARPEHTLIHLYTGTVLTILEPYHVVMQCLNQAAHQAPGFYKTVPEAPIDVKYTYKSNT